MLFDTDSGGSKYEIQKSLRFRASASAHLSRTPSVTGNRKTWTWSGWFKGMPPSGTNAQLFSTTLYNSGSNSTYLMFAGQTFTLASVISGTAHIVLTSAALFRDPSAWYHLMVTVDTTHATPSSRVKLYVNGSQITSLSTATYPAQNYDTHVNSVVGHFIGSLSVEGVPQQFLDGYLSEINFIDGQALDPSYFGQVSAETGAWIPKKYTGTYGTNGFYLPFNDGSTLANLTTDRSGNGNNWTATNISLTTGSSYDWMDDTPTNNFAVLNLLNTYVVSFISNASLRFANTNSYWANTRATCQVPIGGKYYVELTSTQPYTVNNVIYLGLCTPSMALSASSGDIANINNSAASGEVLALAIDRVSNQVSYYRNNSLISTASISATADMDVVVGAYASNGDINFGQRPFAYSPPAGFKALCTKNLPTPSIPNPKKHFDVRTRAGNGGTQTQTGLLFQPYFKWTKNRQSTYNNVLTDGVRGVNQFLYSNTTGVEATASGNVFDATEYTLGPSAEVNANGEAYVDWLWKAGGAPVTNNAGSIQSQVSANQQAGFSIVTYTGTGVNATVGHGLPIKPKLVIIKNCSVGTTNWTILHTDLGNQGSYEYFLQFDTAAKQATTTAFPIGNWTSTTIPTGSNNNVNGNGNRMIAYCFAEIPGYSKIGSYTGNGSADGPFVYCGFRPRYVLIKRTDAAGQSWLIEDSSRNPTNATGLDLIANGPDAEANNTPVMDFVSNGFKLRNTFGGYNTNGGTYIFYAIAEQPFQFANAR